MVSGLSTGATHVGFEMVDGSFHNGSYLICVIPLVGILLDSGEHT